MKIVVIGSTGVIGAAVVNALKARHEVIGVSRHSTPGLDIEDHATIPRLFDALTGIDAVVSCAGSGAWKPVSELTDKDFAYSLGSKLMGQVNVVRQALAKLRDNGSVTVTTGVLAQHAMAGSAAVSMINAGLEGFVRGAALDATRGIRVNAISPPWVKETLVKMGRDPAPGMSAADVAKAYVKAVEGDMRGQTLSP
jgi:NAD(P)-dependent dehydrogenase (short-subunit alcohol dehydrogenase family)